MQSVLLHTHALITIWCIHPFTKAWFFKWRGCKPGQLYYFNFLQVGTYFAIYRHWIMKIYHACVSFFSCRMSFCLLLLKPHKLCNLPAALTLDSTGRAVGEGDAPIHSLFLHVFAGQTEHSCPTLEDCKNFHSSCTEISAEVKQRV